MSGTSWDLVEDQDGAPLPEEVQVLVKERLIAELEDLASELLREGTMSGLPGQVAVGRLRRRAAEVRSELISHV